MWLMLCALVVAVPLVAADKPPEFYEKCGSLQQTMLTTRARLQQWQAEQRESQRAVQAGPWYGATAGNDVPWDPSDASRVGPQIASTQTTSGPTWKSFAPSWNPWATDPLPRHLLRGTAAGGLSGDHDPCRSAGHAYVRAEPLRVVRRICVSTAGIGSRRASLRCTHLAQWSAGAAPQPAGRLRTCTGRQTPQLARAIQLARGHPGRLELAAGRQPPGCVVAQTGAEALVQLRAVLVRTGDRTVVADRERLSAIRPSLLEHVDVRWFDVADGWLSEGDTPQFERQFVEELAEKLGTDGAAIRGQLDGAARSAHHFVGHSLAGSVRFRRRTSRGARARQPRCAPRSPHWPQPIRTSIAATNCLAALTNCALDFSAPTIWTRPRSQTTEPAERPGRSETRGARHRQPAAGWPTAAVRETLCI